jgi:hypothetical protein
MSKKWWAQGTNDTIGTFSGRSSVKLQRMRISRLAFETQSDSYKKVYTKHHIAATCVPRSLPASDTSHITSNTHFNIHFKPTQNSPGLGMRQIDPKLPSPQADPCQPCSTMRCGLEGWRDGTGPYDVGNMAMHSRFPNSGLGRGSGNLFPLAPPLLCILLCRT